MASVIVRGVAGLSLFTVPGNENVRRFMSTWLWSALQFGLVRYGAVLAELWSVCWTRAIYIDCVGRLLEQTSLTEFILLHQLPLLLSLGIRESVARRRVVSVRAVTFLAMGAPVFLLYMVLQVIAIHHASLVHLS